MAHRYRIVPLVVLLVAVAASCKGSGNLRGLVPHIGDPAGRDAGAQAAAPALMPHFTVPAPPPGVPAPSPQQPPPGVAPPAAPAEAPPAVPPAPPEPPAPPDEWPECDEVLRKALALALKDDEAGAYARYLDLVHPEQKHNERAKQYLRIYDWARFRRQAHLYVPNPNEVRFVVVRREPERLGPADNDAKAFVGRAAAVGLYGQAPIHFRRNEQRAWRVFRNSL